MDCDCSVINVKVSGESLATWRTSQLVWEIGSQNQIESIPDQNSWSKLLFRVGKDLLTLKKKWVGKSALKRITSRKNFSKEVRLLRADFPTLLLSRADENLWLYYPKNSAFKKGEGEKNEEHELSQEKIPIPLLLVNCLWHVTYAPSNVTPPTLSPV